MEVSMKKLLCFLLALMLAAACTSALGEDTTKERNKLAAAARANSPTAGSHVTVGNMTPVKGDFFTTHFGNDTSDIDIRHLIHGYNPIVWTSQLVFQTDPMVVTSLEKEADSEGNVTYKVSLARNLTWNDGTPITAADFVFAYLLQASPAFAEIGGNTGMWSHVIGYDAYSLGEKAVYEGIRLTGEYGFSMKVKAQYEPYFYELSYLSAYPCPISVIAPGCEVADDGSGAYLRSVENGKNIEEVFNAEVLQKTILDPETGYMSHPALTSGPYNLVSYDPETATVEMKRNEYFKGNYENVKPSIESLTLIPVSEYEAADLLKDGKIDILHKTVKAELIDKCLNLPGVSDTRYDRLGYGFLAFACEQGPQQFEAVRQAIAYAFDSETFIRKYLDQYGVRVKGYYGIGLWMTKAAMGELRPTGAKDDELAKWDSLTLDGLNDYVYNLGYAEWMLESDGWTLNEAGEPYNPDKDTLRYKKINDELIPLSFRFIRSKGSSASAMACEMLQTALEQIGGGLEATEMPFEKMLEEYYNTGNGRNFDILFMATNFVSTFDPYMTYAIGKDYEGAMNTSGLYDQELINRAWQMHATEPMDLIDFETRWIRFQERFNEILPTMPIYSNYYYDFAQSRVHNYHPELVNGWGEAILYASADTH